MLRWVEVLKQHIYKQPYIGGQVTCHQDVTFLCTERLTVMGLWFAFEDARRENGCQWARTGGHREALPKRFVRAQEGGKTFTVLDPRPFDEEGLVRSTFRPARSSFCRDCCRIEATPTVR